MCLSASRPLSVCLSKLEFLQCNFGCFQDEEDSEEEDEESEDELSFDDESHMSSHDVSR